MAAASIKNNNAREKVRGRDTEEASRVENRLIPVDVHFPVGSVGNGEKMCPMIIFVLAALLCMDARLV